MILNCKSKYCGERGRLSTLLRTVCRFLRYFTSIYASYDLHHLIQNINEFSFFVLRNFETWKAWTIRGCHFVLPI